MGTELGASQEHDSISGSGWKSAHLDREQRHARTVDTNPPARLQGGWQHDSSLQASCM